MSPKAGREPYRREQFRGHLRAVDGQVKAIDRELRYTLPQARKGTRDYREQAEKLLARIDHRQRVLTAKRASAEWWSWRAWGKRTKRDEGLFEWAEGLAKELTKLRTRAKRAVAEPIKLDITTTKPAKRPAAPAKRRRWTAEEAYFALVDFTRRNRRKPKATDFPGNTDLPSYAKVHDLLGGLAGVADDLDEVLRYDAANPTT